MNYFAVGHSSECFSFIKDGWRRRSGANWRMLRSERASAGDDGVSRGCTTLSGCSTPIECDVTGRKSPQQDRSHKPRHEANGGAQCGKSARCVRRGGGWKRGMVEIHRPTGAPVLDPTWERAGVKFPRATRLPLYRQSEIYAREGLELDRSTLCDWVGQAAWLLDPVVAAIRRHVFAGEKIHGDDTTVPVLAPGLGRTKTGRLWVYVRDDRPFCGAAPPAAAYFYSPDRGGQHPASHMAAFTGLLQADGYAGFEALYGAKRTAPGPITEVACWAHCRRGFFDEWEHRKSAVAKEALDRIAAIYVIEAKAAFAPAAERVALRAETAPLLDRFFAWAEATVAKLSAKSALAAAFRYTINRREALSRFVTDGRLEVDNNIAENAMRIIALGRKNYLFAGSDTGGDRAAAIYTIVQTAKLNGVNPEAYLKETLTKIAEGHPINKIQQLMPWQMLPPAAAQPA